MEIGREGLRVRQTDATRNVLARAAAASTDDGTFASYAGESTVPFRILRRACEIARSPEGTEHPGTGGGGGPWLQDVVRGGGVQLVAPVPPPEPAPSTPRSLDCDATRTIANTPP